MARAPDEKINQAHELYKSGVSLTEIASQLSIPAGTVRSWKNRYKWGNDECNATEKSVATEKRNVANKNKVKNKVVTLGVKQVLENYDLTEKQQEFCFYYSKSFNATQSYLKVYGCSYKTAMVEGCTSLRNPKIRAEIMRLKELKAASIMISEEDIIEKYMNIAFVDMTDFVKFGAGGVMLRKDSEVDGSLISEVSSSDTGVKIKLADRMKALEWLSNYFSMNPMNKHKIEFDKRKLELEEKRADVGDDTKTINLIHSIPRPVEL